MELINTNGREITVKPMKLIDRDGGEHTVKSMMVKDWKRVAELLPFSLNALGINNDGEVGDIEEQHQMLLDLMELCGGKDFDLEMAREAVKHYLGLGTRTIAVHGNIKVHINEEKTMRCGRTIVDRSGREFTVYTYKLSDFHKAMELLRQVDVLDVSDNLDEGYSAMIEIIYLALDGKMDKEAIEKTVDAEVALRAMRFYFGLSA